jgi:hypothetical protein
LNTEATSGGLTLYCRKFERELILLGFNTTDCFTPYQRRSMDIIFLRLRTECRFSERETCPSAALTLATGIIQGKESPRNMCNVSSTSNEKGQQFRISFVIRIANRFGSALNRDLIESPRHGFHPHKPVDIA